MISYIFRNSLFCDMFLQGLDEEGLYRISGQAVAVDELKDEFEKSMSSYIYYNYVQNLFSE